jgi:hypothetical protein
MSEMTATAKYAEFALGIIHSLFKCKLKFTGQEVLLFLLQFFATIQISINEYLYCNSKYQVCFVTVQCLFTNFIPYLPASTHN